MSTTSTTTDTTTITRTPEKPLQKPQDTSESSQVPQTLPGPEDASKSVLERRDVVPGGSVRIDCQTKIGLQFRQFGAFGLGSGVRRRHAEVAIRQYGWTRDRLMQLDRLTKTLGMRTLEINEQAIYLGTAQETWLAAYHERDMSELWAALMHDQSSFVAYTDGSGTSNIKPAGLGVVLIRTFPSDVDPTGKMMREEIDYVGENCGNGTNNHAELSAVWRALTMVPHLRRPLIIRADSLYAIGCSTDFTWNIKANHDLVAKIRNDLARRLDVTFEHVRGHSGDLHNEQADRLANEGRRKGVDNANR